MSRIILASAAAFETDDCLLGFGSLAPRITRVITGVGLTEAAMVASRTIGLVQDRDVIFCCTAGSVGQFDGVKLYTAGNVELASWDIRQHKTALLDEFDRSIQLHPLDFGLNSCKVLCSLGVTVSTEDLSSIKYDLKQDHLVESIELYAIARAWLPVVRSFTAIVAVTNETGLNARLQWQQNFRLAASETARFLTGKRAILDKIGVV